MLSIIAVLLSHAQKGYGPYLKTSAITSLNYFCSGVLCLGDRLLLYAHYRHQVVSFVTWLTSDITL